MDVVIVTVMVIGALLAIASAVWVAISLISAISTRRDASAARRETNQATEDCNVHG